MLSRSKPLPRSRKPLPRKRRGKRRGRQVSGAFPVESPTRSEAYKKWIRQRGCIVPGCPRPAEAAHVGEEDPGNHAMGRKCSDLRTVGLCFNHHQADPASLHRIGARFWDLHGIDPEATILALNQEYARRNAA